MQSSVALKATCDASSGRETGSVDRLYTAWARGLSNIIVASVVVQIMLLLAASKVCTLVLLFIARYDFKHLSSNKLHHGYYYPL